MPDVRPLLPRQGRYSHDRKGSDTPCGPPHISVSELVEKYTEERGGKLHLIVNEEEYCIFYKEGCGVHPGRPDVCRAWPYFRGNLVDEMSWEMIQEYCPGVNPEAGHKEFVRQGKQYLRDEDLLRYDPDSSPNALISDD